jgi:hypothetical protein
MLPELKRNLKNLIFLVLIASFLFYLWHDAQVKSEQRVQNKAKYGIHMVSDTDINNVEKEIKKQIDTGKRIEFNRFQKGDALLYYLIVNGKENDPVSTGRMDPKCAIIIKEFQYKGKDIIIYSQKQ